MKHGGSIHKRVMYYAQQEKEVLYCDLNIKDTGYTERQAEKSREKYGSNLISGRASDTIFYRLRRAFINPFTTVLLALAVVSFITDMLQVESFSRNVTASPIIFCMLVVSGMIRFIQEMKSKKVADHLVSLLHSTVTVLREGKWTELSSSELTVGDQVRIFAGDRIPADIRLTKTADLFLSQSVITGESAVLEKTSGKISIQDSCTYSDYKNIAWMGSAVMGGSGEGIVLAVGPDTVYGGFSGMISQRKNKFDQGAASIARVLLRFMGVLIPIVFVACGLTKGNWAAAFLFALSVAVGLTPEMLPMVINACLAKGSASMGKKQTVVKNINAMQGFGSMDVLCVDKTGTLTGDIILLEYYMDILGNESERVLELSYLNSLYHTGVRNHLDTAVLKYREMPGLGEQLGRAAEQKAKLDEIPFDYERKIASILVGGEENNLLIVKGSIEEVCRRCRYVEYKGEKREKKPENSSDVHAVVDEILEDGMKVLAVAYKPVKKNNLTKEDETDLILIGYLAFFDAPKKTAADAIGKLKALQVGIRVLTGDQKSVAASVCHRLGIDTSQILTGAELDAMSEEKQIMQIENTMVFAELSPKQKAEIVETLQANGHTVGYLGDGMNDLPAMVESDVGISVDTAAEAVKEGADVILLKKDLNVLEEGILEGRKAFSNMTKYIRITASSNFGNIFSIVIASVVLPFLPITSVQLLLLNLLYDTLCLVLPWDHVDQDACSRPLEWSGRTLGRFMKFFGPVSSFFDVITFLFLYFIFCPALCGGEFAQLTETAAQTQFIMLFQTGWFLESMWTQVLILHLLRTRRIPMLQSRPSGPVMFVTTVGILFFTVLTFTPLGKIIGMMAMPVSYFGFLVGVVILYLFVVTVAKGIYVRKYKELF
ncbi:magnesium-translocating P-type ATPase [Drancourtella massiliensis]|uniref:Magnesium-transporting ATPase, P-type 1 n=1 Tax=Drancourtella massiliensis TaxID=1632013 RepID=A0ABS2EHH4_9FIRM|nr:magnesium-translocating P-type ATPase [Drancourtella massiliensis]MBM6744493.1 magnesium-translocating P-type ATPase [Drancourtella massiliensis]